MPVFVIINLMSCKNCKKLIVAGAISVSLIGSSPLCKECLATQVPDLPSGNEPSSKGYNLVNRVFVSNSGTSVIAGVYIEENGTLVVI